MLRCRRLLSEITPGKWLAKSNKAASLEESVGEFWFGEGAEVVIEGDFVGFLGAKTV